MYDGVSSKTAIRTVEADLKKIGADINQSSNPVKTGRQVLFDNYIRTGGVAERNVRAAAVFELVRSKAVQAVYEETTGASVDRDWPHNMILSEELDEAVRIRDTYLEVGMQSLIIDTFPGLVGSDLNMLRMALDREANSVERFLGSVRRYVPGVGYSITIRKRYMINQDSYLMGSSGDAVLLGVADGCSSELFASLASYLSVRRIMQQSDRFLLNPKETLCEISTEIASILNSPDLTGALGGRWGGNSTLTVGVSRNDERHVLKVGDSTGFRICRLPGDEPTVEVLNLHEGLSSVMGQAIPLHEDDIEDYGGYRGQLVLTTDGVTGFLEDTAGLLRRLGKLTSNCVMIAERVVREVLKRQIEADHADDVTIVVQDAT